MLFLALYVNGMVACNNILLLTHDRETQVLVNQVMMLNLEKARDLGVGSG